MATGEQENTIIHTICRCVALIFIKLLKLSLSSCSRALDCVLYSIPVSHLVLFLFSLSPCLFIFLSFFLLSFCFLYHISFQLLCLCSFLCLFHSFSLFLSVYVSFSPVCHFFSVRPSLRLLLSLSSRHKSLSCWLLKCEEWQI